MYVFCSFEYIGFLINLFLYYLNKYNYSKISLNFMSGVIGSNEPTVAVKSTASNEMVNNMYIAYLYPICY